MSRRYSFEDPEPPPLPASYQDQGKNINISPPNNQQEQPQQQIHSPPHSPTSPAAHPDSSFNRLRAARRYSRERENRPLVGYGEPTSPVPASPPPPPPHRDIEGRIWGRELGYTNSVTYENITPGVDNFGEQAVGGIAGVAMSVADANARESGVEAMRNTPGYDQRQMYPSEESQYGRPPPPTHQPYDEAQYGRAPPQQPYEESPHMRSQPYQDSPYARPAPRQEVSHSSLTPLGAAAFPPGNATPQATPYSRSTSSRSPHSFNNEQPYADSPYNRYSRNLDPSFGGGINPDNIADDGDDGLDYRQPNRGSLLSLGHHSDRNIPAAAAGGAAAGGVLGALGGMVGRNGNGSQQYDAVHPYAGSGSAGTGGPNDYDLGQEKSEWLSKQKTGSKKLRWLIGVIVAIVVAGAIAGGVAGGILSKNKQSSSSSEQVQGQSAKDDTSNNGDLNSNSSEIKKLLGNKNLHKVFPGVDYTPMYTQYPECTKYAASQNNVTRDVAVLSQLTNVIRLYGTDCNATQLVIHAIDQLGLKGKVKIWLGVWQDKDKETNARQIKQMYDIFDNYKGDYFEGIIVGNEVLFRQDFTITELGTLIKGIKETLKTKNIDLPIASSDLGDDWTQGLADEVDIVMANIHPFFAGVTAAEAAGWTWSFWQNKNIPLKTDKTKHIISETGWPSTGGKNCGEATTCAIGSVAGIPEMNTFLDTWVCQALANGTNYFLFEAFDEPWKIKFNEPGKEWEDKWGIMDVNRNLKPGVIIPDCGGKTVDG